MSKGAVCLQVADGGTTFRCGLQMTIYWIRSRGSPPAWVVGEEQTTPHHCSVKEHKTRPRNGNDLCYNISNGTGRWDSALGKWEVSIGHGHESGREIPDEWIRFSGFTIDAATKKALYEHRIMFFCMKKMKRISYWRNVLDFTSKNSNSS
jgi:hypothetical protein